MPYLGWSWNCPRFYGTHPMQLVRDLNHYRAQKILWAEVDSDGSGITLFISANKSTIRIEGYAVHLRTFRGQWEVGNWSQWSGGPYGVTQNLTIPPD
jgi:hypothetical protein